MKKTMISLLLILALWGLWKWKSKGAGSAAPLWKKIQVTRGDLVLGVQATGNVQPQNRVAIKAPVSGRIEEILVREGDWVKRGQILAWMSSGDRASLLDAARAKGPEELKRWEELYKAAPLISPITVTIIARNVEPGQSVSSSDSPLVVSDRLIVKAQVDETDVAKIKLGQKVRVTLDAYADQPIEAKVDHIAFEARTVNNVTIYDIEVLPKAVPGFMRSGMTANAQFQTDAREHALLLPADAVQYDAEHPYVYMPAPGSPTAQALDPPKEEAKGAEGWKGKKWGHKKKSDWGKGEWKGGEGGKPWGGQGGKGGDWPKTGAAPASAGEDYDAGKAAPITRAVEVGISDEARIEIVSGLQEGDSVLVKAVVLPTAVESKNPFSMRPTRPQPRKGPAK